MEPTQTSTSADGLYTPIFLRSPSDELSSLLSDATVRVVDEYQQQLQELIQCEFFGRPLSKDQLADEVSNRIGDRDVTDCGIWVYYPWSNTLVHLLEETEFIRLRTDRNRNKITAAEQESLNTRSIGVVGLSVGRAVAVTLAQERIAGEIRLADMDLLELSNLNRIKVGLHDLGRNKAVSAAREIASIDPFIEVKVFNEGLQDHNMNDFFLCGGKLDLLIEECDSVSIKIKSRQKAKELGIPVVMDTSDRGMIDVERFDLEPDRPLLHGWISHLDLTKLSPGMSNEDKIPYLLPMLGAENMSPRMKASALEIGHSQHTWPQLATSVNLGGAITADVARRILLDGFHSSGRWYVDTEQLIADPVQDDDIVVQEHTPLTSLEAQLIAMDLDVDDGEPIPYSAVQSIINAGALAPSAGNMQPWHFHCKGGRILIIHDEQRSHSAFDKDHMIADIAFGSCIANMLIAGRAEGIELGYELFPSSDQRIIASLWATGNTEQHGHALAEWIHSRVTDRTMRPSERLERAAINNLLDFELESNTKARFYGDEIRLSSIAEICGKAEQLRAMNPIGHHELFHQEFRWTREEVERTRDGLDIETLELNEVAKAGMVMASDYRAIQLLKNWNQGSAFKVGATAAVNSSHGVMLISAKGRDRRDRISAGISAERFWLHANRSGYSVHPVSAPIFLTQHNELQNGAHLRSAEQDTLTSMQHDLRRLFDLPPGEHPVFMMRVGTGGEPSCRSLRRPISEMISFSKVSVGADD